MRRRNWITDRKEVNTVYLDYSGFMPYEKIHNANEMWLANMSGFESGCVVSGICLFIAACLLFLFWYLIVTCKASRQSRKEGAL